MAYDDFIGKTCPYCQTKIERGDRILVCNRCETPHHAECWKENGKCTTYMCRGLGTSPDRITPTKRPETIVLTDLSEPANIRVEPEPSYRVYDPVYDAPRHTSERREMPGCLSFVIFLVAFFLLLAVTGGSFIIAFYVAGLIASLVEYIYEGRRRYD